MTSRMATLHDTTVCGVERALLDTSFISLFISIERNAVSVINLNYSTCIKSFAWKIVKNFLKRLLFHRKFLSSFLLILTQI